MKNIVVLGATGNLGLQTLEVLKSYKKSLRIFGLSGFKNKKLLDQLAKNVLTSSPKDRRLLVATTPSKILELSTNKNANIIINLISGIAGLKPTLSALKAGKIVILANKESLFLEGKKIMKLARLGENLIPLDSEHNAIFEILKFTAAPAFGIAAKFCLDTTRIQKIILTGSGGAFFGKTAKQLEKLTAKDAFKNSVWKMGPRISIESATLINKGLEIIEAHHLFNVPLKNIEIKIDKAAHLHAVVKFKTGKMLGYFSPPDMRHHIKNALDSALQAAGIHQKTSPGTPGPIREISKKELATLSSPDHKTFPGIKIVLSAYKKSARKQKLRLAFLKNEEKIIANYINGKITFPEIFKKLS